MTRAQRFWHARVWLLLSALLAIALTTALARRQNTRRVETAAAARVS